MLNFIIALFCFFLLVFSTFFVIDIPFITISFYDISSNTNIFYSDYFFTIGTFEGNFQISCIILSAILLNPKLNFFFLLTYLFIGLYGYPIFYYGGGSEYFAQNAIGYLISFFPVSLTLSYLCRINNNYERYLFNKKYVFGISIISLFIIHSSGIITIFFTSNSIKFSELIQNYFFIPLLSQIMLIYVICTFSISFNTIKYRFLSKHKKYVDEIFKSGIKRRKLSKNKV